MAVGDIEDEATGSPPPPGGNAPPPDAGGGGAPGGGGPMMAALGRNTQQQQPSAPGMGDSANSMQKLISAVTMIQQAAVGLPPGSPLWKDAMDAAKRLGRHLPQGAPTAGVQMTGIRDLLKQVMSSSFLPQIMAQLQGRGQQGAGQNAPAGAAPMPSMPLPGA